MIIMKVSGNRHIKINFMLFSLFRLSTDLKRWFIGFSSGKIIFQQPFKIYPVIHVVCFKAAKTYRSATTFDHLSFLIIP